MSCPWAALLVRGEIATDVIHRGEEIYYCEAAPGEMAAFTLTGDRHVELWQLACHFGLWPWTAWIDGVGREGTLHIDEVQRKSGRTGSVEQPFLVRGYSGGPFSRGYLGSFCSSLGHGGDGVLDLEIQEPLHVSFSVAVYKAANLNTGEQLVLKLDYEPNRSLGLKLSLEAEALFELRDKGIVTPSLPILVRHGHFHPSGSLRCQFGDVCGLVTKPLGRSMEGMVFHGAKLCKVALDVLLALYHLHLVGRKHRDVRVQNMVLVGEDQCMLVDLEMAYSDDLEHLYGGDKDQAAASDCHGLLLSLLELSGHGRAQPEPSMIVQLLSRESEVIGDFARHVLGLPRQAWPDFNLWLATLTLAVQGAGLSRKFVEDAFSSDMLSPAPLPLGAIGGYPSNALWIEYRERTRYFLPEGGRFPLAQVKHVWNLCQVTVAGELIHEQRLVSELCRGVQGRGSREDPLRISGKPGVPPVIRCQDAVPEQVETLLCTGVPHQVHRFAGLSQALARRSVASANPGASAATTSLLHEQPLKYLISERED